MSTVDVVKKSESLNKIQMVKNLNSYFKSDLVRSKFELFFY